MDIIYTSFENFLTQINPILEKGIPDLYLNMRDCFVEPKKCAQDMEVILTKYSKFLPNLTIDFSHYHYSYYPYDGWSYPYRKGNLDAIASAIANAMKEDYPKGLKINFDSETGDSACFIPFAQALKSGHYHEGFSISFRYPRLSPAAQAEEFKIGKCPIDTIAALAEALKSGNCPRGLEIEITATISDEDVNKLVSALVNKNCPEDLHLKLSQCGNYAADYLSVILKKGYGPQGLKIHVNHKELGALKEQNIQVSKLSVFAQKDSQDTAGQSSLALINYP